MISLQRVMQTDRYKYYRMINLLTNFSASASTIHEYTPGNRPDTVIGAEVPVPDRTNEPVRE